MIVLNLACYDFCFLLARRDTGSCTPMFHFELFAPAVDQTFIRSETSKITPHTRKEHPLRALL